MPRRFNPDLPALPRGDDPPGNEPPQGTYFLPGAPAERSLVLFRTPARTYYPPKKLDFRLLATGKLPLVYVPEYRRPRKDVTLAHVHLLRNLRDPDAWDRMLAICGITNARLWVVDRRGERYRVVGLEYDYGGESGQLKLQPTGKASRGGVLKWVDIEDGYGYMIPIVTYPPVNVIPRGELPDVGWADDALVAEQERRLAEAEERQRRAEAEAREKMDYRERLAEWGEDMHQRRQERKKKPRQNPSGLWRHWK